MTFARRRSLIAAAVAVALAATAVVSASPTSAQQSPAAESKQVSSGRGLVSIDVDVLKAEDRVVSTTLADIRENVQTQKAALRSAQEAATAAKNNLAVAEKALADTQKRLNALTDKADAVVIDSFVNPPTQTAFDALSAESLEDATIKQSILNFQADDDAELLGDYLAIQDELVKERRARRKAAAAAEDAQHEAEAAFADVQEAVGQQATFAAEVEARLDQRLAEADNLAETDPELAAQIRARAGELAMILHELDEEVQAERAREKAAELASQAELNKSVSSQIKPVPGGVATAACPGGGSIQIAGDIQKSVERLLADISAAGITMCGHGYRDPAEQIALRRSNCGTSTYAIYTAPSSYCSPPTARPGMSLHEQGLAIDFTVGGSTIRRGSAAYNWLVAHAADYGLYNLPSEAWHWSVNGE